MKIPNHTKIALVALGISLVSLYTNKTEAQSSNLEAIVMHEHNGKHYGCPKTYSFNKITLNCEKVK
jgi:hypothetical protein